MFWPCLTSVPLRQTICWPPAVAMLHLQKTFINVIYFYRHQIFMNIYFNIFLHTPARGKY